MDIIFYICGLPCWIKIRLSRTIIISEIEIVVKFPNQKKTRAVRYSPEFYQTLKEESTLILLQLFHKAEIEETLPNSLIIFVIP